MATKFLEPGGDATFNVATTTAGGFWKPGAGTPATATDFVHGNHQKSIKYAVNAQTYVQTPDAVLADAGTRISCYIYLNALPTGTVSFYIGENSGFNIVFAVAVTSGGVLQLRNNSTQIGSNGGTLSTGIWYRISLAYTITSTTVNRFELFKDGVSTISVTNATLGFTGATHLRLGANSTDATFDLRSSDLYIDDSSSLTDTGDIWVTAKRPNANGTTNGFTTQIGSGGSGYGSGHSPQVNERPLSNTNGWSIQSASKQTEEYSIESQSQGDINITGATIIDYMGWVDCKVGVNSTGNIIVGGTASNISVTTTETVFTKIAGSTTYPAGNTDIGMDTNTVNQLFSLYECGIVVAYIPASSPFTVVRYRNY